MSVRTTADEKLDEARKHIYQAVLALNEIVILECYGHDDFDQDTKDKVRESFQNLLKIRQELKR